MVTLGFSGTIQTAFVERFNGTLRHGISTLVRRTGGKAQLVGELTLHLEWFRAYYSFVRPHGSLREALEIPLRLPGRVQHNRQRTPAMVAGIASHRWTTIELLSFPIAAIADQEPRTCTFVAEANPSDNWAATQVAILVER